MNAIIELLAGVMFIYPQTSPIYIFIIACLYAVGYY